MTRLSKKGSKLPQSTQSLSRVALALLEILATLDLCAAFAVHIFLYHFELVWLWQPAWAVLVDAGDLRSTLQAMIDGWLVNPFKKSMMLHSNQ